MKTITIVHAPDYNNWVFDPTHPTQGRRFVNGFDMIVKNPGTRILEPRLATYKELASVHSPTYLSQVLHSHVTSQWDGPRPDLAQLAQLFVGGTLVALDALLSGDTLLAINLPGAKHHAMRAWSSGFCVFADFAIAAQVATDLGLRVAILDIDAHHGDGTEALTQDNPDILSYSVHQYGIFPGTGLTSDPAKRVFNWPLMDGDGDGALLDAVNDFNYLTEVFQPDLIFIAGGADGHARDPLSGLQYTCLGMKNAMLAVRTAHPVTPILFGGAGGYLPDFETPTAWASMITGLTAVDSAKPRLTPSI